MNGSELMACPANLINVKGTFTAVYVPFWEQCNINMYGTDFQWIQGFIHQMLTTVMLACALVNTATIQWI